MPAVKTDLTIEQGADWSHGWLVTYNGEPIDETWTARSQVRKTANTEATLHEFTASVTADGAVIITATAAESSGWEWRAGVYDVEVTGGEVTLRVARGSVGISAEVTR